MEKNNDDDDAVIELNVGGKVISTLQSTLMKESDSKMAKMLQESDLLTRDSSGRFYLDCDPDIFCHVLEFLRFGVYPSNDNVMQVYDYAQHFGISTLVNSLEQFQTVQYKKRSDEAKSKLDLEKYETLKNDVIAKLLDGYPSGYKCIYMVTNSVNYTMNECLHEQHEVISTQVQGGQSFARTVEVSKPAIRTDLPISDVNLTRALFQDLCQLEYGKPRFFIKPEERCNNCTGYPAHQYLYILLIKKYENEKLNMKYTKECSI